MKFRIYRYALFFALSSLSACAPVTIEQLEKDGGVALGQAQLQQLITDHTLHLESIDLDAKVHYLPDGHLNATNLYGEEDTGKWSIAAGDQLCMKFDHWYYGDLKCYRLFIEKDSYVFFTDNGARSYTATTTKAKNTIMAASPASGTNTNRTVDQEDSPATPLSQEDRAHNLVSLARNCPGCNLAGVDLIDARLVAANLAGANLSGADLRSANLRRANLARANLRGAKLMGTNLAGANLTDADLTDADLTGSNLIKANVTGAKMSGAVLSGAHLESITGFKE